ILLLGIVLALICFQVASRLMDWRMSLLAASMVGVVVYGARLDATHHWLSLIFALSAVRVLLPARTTFRVAIAGALLGIATFCTQTAGVFALLAIGASLVWEHLSKKSHRSAVRLQALLVIAFIAVWFSLSAPYIASVGWKHFWYLQVTY